MKQLMTVLWMAYFAAAFASARVVVPQLPPSPYDDTEISTNVAFSAGRDDSRLFSLSLSVDATPSNTVQIAFGSDGDSDGVLSWRETDFLLGWRCGSWFCRDKMSGAEASAPRASGLRHLEWRLSLDGERSPRGLSATDGGDDIGFVVTPGMFRPNWNLMRVTVRGMPGQVFAAEGEVSAPGFSMRVR